ncbi:NACHT, LRR and PYD domains-containing protein 3-like [Stylophora pistillata]|uniref:NACHT, LRR and PYD domains-containing protein 3-like n=1 Tax=Stylophora pistillata TaxID=50429 RepID=UPI000C04AA1F|nr:NACHT, LRR and PYD domains-containing protein 3-like [Stylophora pistillata]
MATTAAPVSFSSTKETTNYARLCRLLVDVGCHVLRDTFDSIHPPSDLHKNLMTHHAKLQILQKKRVLNPTQWGNLYPPIRTSVSSKNFDITLLTVLLRNICSLSPPVTGWDALPPATDISTEADIARMKYYRNTVYAHADKASVDDAKFNGYWQDIRDALVRLGGLAYGVAIDDLKNECMDPLFEEHYRELLKEWKRDDDNTKEKLDEIHWMLEELMKASTSTSLPKDVDEPTELIKRIRQLYQTREGRHSPFPWCEEFNFDLNDIFTRPTIVRQGKTRRTAVELVTSITAVFKPHSGYSKPRTVLIEGEPGMGKTTYCQKIAYDWANGQETDPSFPKIKLVLLLKCHEMTGNIWEAIDDQLLPTDIEEDERENFFKYIRDNQSQVLLVLDGLDEAPPNLMKLFSGLVESRELSECHIILTSRQEGSVKISKFCDTLCKLEGFASETSHSYINHYFKDLEAQGQKLLSDIEQNIELGELIVNPLFTAMLCLVYEDLEGGLPLSKTQLYLEITECILKRFCQKQGLCHSNGNLIDVFKEQLGQLGRIALEALKRDMVHIEEGELTGTRRNSPLFEFLSVQSSSSKRRFHTCFRFSHKSFQEFFAGVYLSGQISKGETNFERLLANERGNLKVIEQVLLFTVGILGHKSGIDAVSLLKIITEKSNLSQKSCLPNFYLSFALKTIGECSTENSKLRSQMIHLFGTNLQLQYLIITDNSFPINLLLEALQVNSTMTYLHIDALFLEGHYIVSLANMLQVNKTLTTVFLPASCFVSGYSVQLLVDALMVNTTLLHLYLGGSAWGNDGARILVGYLKRNKTLSALHLNWSDIDDAGATALAEVLWTNTTLTVLDLCQNPGIGNPGAMSLCEALKVNKILDSLDLSGTGISDQGVHSLAGVLKTNTCSLASLSLSEIKISHQSFKSMAEVLRVNSTLKELEFQGNKVGVGGARLITKSLKVNTTLKILDLSRNNFKASCGRLLSDALKVNGTLECLILAENALGARGAQLLSEGFRVNTSLKHLDLCFHNADRSSLLLSDFVCSFPLVYALLAVSPTKLTQHLDLSRNSIGEEGADSIAETIRVNATLTHLLLSGNNIGDRGAKKVSEALKVNVSLKDLNLSYNCIFAAGADSIAETLKSNATVTDLDLTSNFIGDNGAQSLCEAFKTNTTLTALDVSNNNIHSAGAQAFVELQQHNNTLRRVVLTMNNIGGLGELGDQELDEVPMGSLSLSPFSLDFSQRFNNQGTLSLLLSEESLMLPRQ